MAITEGKPRRRRGPTSGLQGFEEVALTSQGFELLVMARRLKGREGAATGSPLLVGMQEVVCEECHTTGRCRYEAVAAHGDRPACRESVGAPVACRAVGRFAGAQPHTTAGGGKPAQTMRPEPMGEEERRMEIDAARLAGDRAQGVGVPCCPRQACCSGWPPRRTNAR
jgi:hypothetical protein